MLPCAVCAAVCHVQQTRERKHTQTPTHPPSARLANNPLPPRHSIERLLSLVHGVGGASLLVGGAGTAKTATVAQFLASFSPEGPAATLSKVVTFSSLTTPHIFQLTIEGAVEKRQGRT